MDLEKNIFHAKLQRSTLFNNCVQVPTLRVGLSFFVFDKFHFQIDEDESSGGKGFSFCHHLWVVIDFTPS